MDLEARKRELRRRARALAGAGNAEAAQRNLLDLEELRGARRVALYAALRDEPPLVAVGEQLERQGVEIAFPRVGGRELRFHRARRSELRPGYRGIREPAEGSPVVALAAIDVFVVPGLLFDRSGARLGRGSGFYDRALARARADARKVGMCYADRVVECLPRAPEDVAMDVIVTDQAVLRPGQERG